jgi:hypothetical protein
MNKNPSLECPFCKGRVQEDSHHEYDYPTWKCACGALAAGGRREFAFLDEIADQLCMMIGLNIHIIDQPTPTGIPGVSIGSVLNRQDVELRLRELSDKFGLEFRIVQEGDTLVIWAEKRYCKERDLFARITHKDFNPIEINERVFICARADFAMDIMKFIVHNILGQPDKYSGIEMAKIADFPAVTRRSDNIVVFTAGREATEKVIKVLEIYQQTNPHHFMKDIPAMTEWRLPGVSVGEEPLPPWRGRESFASLRIKIIADALKQTELEGKDKEYFRQLLKRRLRESGVDPDNPCRNLKSYMQVRVSLKDRLEIAREMIIKVLKGDITYETDRMVFDEDLLYLNVRLLEQHDFEWLQLELAKPEHNEQAKREVTINMAKKRT